MASTVVALPPHQNNKKHDIFLSHSGQQKGFARDLCSRLCLRGYSVFFDQNDDSLPPGEAFPPLIFSAANTCDLALVVISDDFLRSKWPMMELCAFVDRLSPRSDRSPDTPHFTILPLFFKLPIEGIKDAKNVEKWRKEWESFERINGRISAAKCEKAVTTVLPTLKGILRDQESQQGESSYIDYVVDRISIILRPRNLVRFREGVDPHKHHVGKGRLCKVILDEFRKLEEKHDSSSSKVNILGMYGVPGSGKSTLCDFLRESMFDEFGGKVIHLKLPTELRECDDLLVKEQYVKLLSVLIPHKKDFTLMDLDQLYYQVYNLGANFNYKMFVVLDNISPSNCERYKTMVKAVVSSGILGAGSRVMLVAQTKAILENVFMEVKDMFSHAITQIPSLTEEEAMELIRNRYPSVTDDVLTHLLQKCSFPFSSFMYIPFVFEQIGILLRDTDCTKVKELEILWKTVEEGKKDAIKMLVDINLKQLPEDLRVLFFDIALYIIPAGYSKLSDAIPILSRMHGINDTFELQWKITKLQKYCALSVPEDALRVHDIFTEYARSIPGNSERYVNRPSLNISHLLANNDQNCPSPTHPRPTEINLKCLEARTICIGIGKGSPYCCNDDEEVFLHLEVGGGAQAVHMRNNLSPYSECILVLAGDPSSLVSLQTENVQLQVSSTAAVSDSILSNLLRLEVRNDKIVEDKFHQMSLSLKRKRMSSSLDFPSRKIQKTVEWMTRWLRKPFFPCRQQLHLRSYVFTRRMPWLRVLVLAYVGMVSLEIVGQHFPVLEILEVQNKPEEPIDVRVWDAPKLRRLVTGTPGYLYHVGSEFRHPISQNSRKLELHLGKCPELQDLQVDGSFDQVKVVGLLHSKLCRLALANDRREDLIPTGLIASSIHRLSQLRILRLRCSKVEVLDFTHVSSLPALIKMELYHCSSLTRLTIGPASMPYLFSVCVSCCDKLHVFEGVQNLLMQQLEELTFHKLPRLQLECDLMRSGCSCEARLQLDIWDCPYVKIDFIVLEASKSLRFLRVSGMFVEQRHKLSYDAIMHEEEEDGNSRLVRAPEHEHVRNHSNDEESSVEVVHGSSSTLNRMVHMKGQFMFLDVIDLLHVDSLQEIEGIQRLLNLRYLHLRDLPKLARVSESWPSSIVWITFDNCPTLLEIPHLELTPNLRSFSCIKCVRLKAFAVKGEIQHMCSDLNFIECESMEVLPMEEQVMSEWGFKRRRSQEYRKSLSVCGSKFASVEVMRTWLRGVELGSPVFEAAVEALVWEHVVKGTSGALDALDDYFSAVVDISGDDLRRLHNIFFPDLEEEIEIQKIRTRMLQKRMLETLERYFRHYENVPCLL